MQHAVDDNERAVFVHPAMSDVGLEHVGRIDPREQPRARSARCTARAHICDDAIAARPEQHAAMRISEPRLDAIRHADAIEIFVVGPDRPVVAVWRCVVAAAMRRRVVEAIRPCIVVAAIWRRGVTRRWFARFHDAVTLRFGLSWKA